MRRTATLAAIAALIAGALSTIGVLNAAPAAACINDECGASDTILFVGPDGPHTYGDPLTIRANLRDVSISCVPACDNPSGSVEFFDVLKGPAPDGLSIGSSVLTPSPEPGYTEFSNSGTITYSGLGVGTSQVIRAIYRPSGSNSFDGSQDTSSPITVTQAVPVIPSFQVSPASSVAGQTVTLTAEVGAPASVDLTHGATRPTGSVEFLDCTLPLASTCTSANFSSLASATFSVININPPTSVAHLDWNLFDAGPHRVMARYLGDDNYVTKESIKTLTVTKGAVANTLTQSVAATVYGEPFTLKSTLAAVSPAAGTPTGTVDFNDITAAPILLGSTAASELNPNTASVTSATVPAGTRSLRATYRGDGRFNAADSNTVTHTVYQATTTTGVASPTANPTTLGQPVTLNASLAVVAPGAGTPTGTVQFKDGAGALGAPVPLSGLTASLTTTNLGGGAHSITAVYSGDSNFATSTSPALTRNVTCDVSVTGPYNGTVTAAPTGTTCIDAANVSGGVMIPAGAKVSITNSTIGGYVSGNGGSANVTICNTTLAGLTIANAAGPVIVGDPYTGSCAGNTITGSATLTSNHGGVRFNANRVGSALQTTGTSGGATVIGGNKVTGWLQCSGNAPVAANGGHPNTAAGRTGECAAPNF